MDNKKSRDSFINEIKQVIQEEGYSIYFFGTWSGKYVWSKNREEISKLLEKDNIEVVNISDYCALYVPDTMSISEKKDFINLLNEKAPEMFEEYIVSLAKRELEEHFNEINDIIFKEPDSPYVQ